MRTLLLILSFLLTLPAYAQDEYRATNDGKLTEVSTWSVNGQPAQTLPTADDTCIIPRDSDYSVGGSITCGDLTIERDIHVSADDTLTVFGDLSWVGTLGAPIRKEGTLIFKGDSPAVMATQYAPSLHSVIVEKAPGVQLELKKENDDQENTVFIAQSLEIRSGIVNPNVFFFYDIAVQEAILPHLFSLTEKPSWVSSYTTMWARHDTVKTDTLQSLAGKVAFHVGGIEAPTLLGFGAFDQGVQEFKESDWYTQGEREPLPWMWEIYPDEVAFTWFFETQASDSIEVYGWRNGDFIPIDQKREPNGWVSVVIQPRGHPVGYFLMLAKVQTNTAAEDEIIPEMFRLLPSYPNPFNPSTTIPFELKAGGKVLLTVHDILGREVQTLVDEYLPVGQHEVIFETEDLPSGLYIIRSNFGQARTVTLLK